MEEDSPEAEWRMTFTQSPRLQRAIPGYTEAFREKIIFILSIQRNFKYHRFAIYEKFRAGGSG